MTSTRLFELHLASLDETEFEEWLCVYFQVLYGLSSPPQRYGRRGHAQHGVDLFMRLPGGELIGVQAKAYAKTTLTTRAIDDELGKAHSFEPKLDRYIICTLNDRDPTLQSHATGITIHGSPSVSLLALQDLAESGSRHESAWEDLVRRAGPLYEGVLDRLESLDRSAATVALSTTEPSAGLDPELRAIEGWIDAGQPLRALRDLDAYDKPISTGARRRLEARARFALMDLAAVVEIAWAEQQEASPSAMVLAYGAQAAQATNDDVTAAQLLAEALSSPASEINAEVVAAYLRVHSMRADRTFDELETFARRKLTDVATVSVALADSAFQLGKFEVASEWYARARDQRPNWPLGAEGNALGAETWGAIRDALDGAQVEHTLRTLVSRLEAFLARVRTLSAPALRAATLMNLGHAYRVLQEYESAASAWDEALALPHSHASLWLHRCVLSINERVPLPAVDLIERWAVTPPARIVLASAYIQFGEPTRAEPLIENVLHDPAATDNDRALAAIESMRRDNPRAKQPSPDQVDTMLALYTQGNRGLPLLAWFVAGYNGVDNTRLDRVREAINELAAVVDLEPEQRLSLTEDFHRAGLDDVTLAWLPALEAIVFDSSGSIASVRAALVLMRAYGRTLRFGAAQTLIPALRALRPDDAAVLLESACVLLDAGGRVEAYELLTSAIEQGQRDAVVLFNWARLAVVLGRRRQGNRLMTQLAVAPENARDLAILVQARAMLGVRGQDERLLAVGRQVTPDNARTLFGASLIGRPLRKARVEFGRVIQLRISDAARLTFDEHVLIAETLDGIAAGVRVLKVSEHPWVRELLGARGGDTLDLVTGPFAGQAATVVDVIEADRWAITQARDLLHLLPTADTGIQAVEGDQAAIMDSVREQARLTQSIQQGRLQLASQQSAWITMLTEAMHTSPRAFLSAGSRWAPTGHPGTADELQRDHSALVTGGRLVFDPVSVLLLLELGAEELVHRMPVKPILTRQAAWLLFDWWFTLERHRPGVAGRMVTLRDGRAVFVAHSARERRELRRYWLKVRRLVTDYFEIVDAEPATEPDPLRVLSTVGLETLSGMIVAHANDWVYVTEEQMVRVVATNICHARVASLHRVINHGVTEGWITESRAARWIAAFIRRGWRWISFPISMLITALHMPENERWPTFSTLLHRVKSADPPIAIQSLCAILTLVDDGAFPSVSARRVREAIRKALPDSWAAPHRAAIAREFRAKNPGRQHRASWRLLKQWVEAA